MSGMDLGLIVYIVSLIGGFFVSYKYGSFMIRKTGLFVPQTFISCAMVIAIDVVAIIAWGYFTWGTSEFVFFLGIALGFGILGISLLTLITILLIKRKKLLHTFNENGINNM
ncbi:hypothetical protein [Pseudalkalibacillus sp. SCS-8]|uniref:hypothetical protein n=1 Tax=Pseudalkalibacillus nanhaiensis TaxID=3115291 RepID=UPI0032DA956B